MRTAKVYLRDSSMITPYPLLLFGGELQVWSTLSLGLGLGLGLGELQVWSTLSLGLGLGLGLGELQVWSTLSLASAGAPLVINLPNTTSLLLPQPQVKHAQQTIAVDRWIEFEAAPRVAVLFRQLRDELNREHSNG